MAEKYGWEKFLIIEKDFMEAQKYVSFNSLNKNTQSIFFSNEVLILGAELEKSFKYLCSLIDPSTPGNISQYKDIILREFPHIVEFNTYVKDSDLCYFPYKNWDNGGLGCWDSYTNLKHNLKKTTSSMDKALEILSAYEIILYVIHSEELKHQGTQQEIEGVNYSVNEMPKMMETHFSRGCAMAKGFIFYYPIEQFRQQKGRETI